MYNMGIISLKVFKKQTPKKYVFRKNMTNPEVIAAIFEALQQKFWPKGFIPPLESSRTVPNENVCLHCTAGSNSAEVL